VPAKSVHDAVELTGEVALANTLDGDHASAEVGKMSRCQPGGNRVLQRYERHPAQWKEISEPWANPLRCCRGPRSCRGGRANG
jgi:hypothetical protein